LVEFLVIGDTHIEAWPKGLPISYDPWQFIFQQVFDYGQKHGIETIVQVGDIFDNSDPEDDSRLFLWDEIERSGMTWHIILGNHDYSDATKNALKYFQKLKKRGHLKNANFYTEPTFTKFGKQPVAFLPWPLSRIKEEKDHICFAHFSLSGSKGDYGFTVKSGVELQKKHQWVLGDLHKPQPHYIGAPLQFKYGEVANRFFGHVYGNEYPYKIKRVPLQLPYRLEVMNLFDEKEGSKVIRKLQERDSNVYTKIKLGTLVIGSTLPLELEKIPRIITEFSGKIKKEQEETNVIHIDSKSVRDDLVRERLRKKGFDKPTRERAMKIVAGIEANISSKR
jgi:Calcineurin-like phosphoesterase